MSNPQGIFVSVASLLPITAAGVFAGHAVQAIPRASSAFLHLLGASQGSGATEPSARKAATHADTTRTDAPFTHQNAQQRRVLAERLQEFAARLRERLAAVGIGVPSAISLEITPQGDVRANQPVDERTAIDELFYNEPELRRELAGILAAKSALDPNAGYRNAAVTITKDRADFAP